MFFVADEKSRFPSWVLDFVLIELKKFALYVQLNRINSLEYTPTKLIISYSKIKNKQQITTRGLTVIFNVY